MKRLNFSTVIAIAAKGFKAMTRTQWEIGDELLRVIGAPARDAGSSARFEQCSEDLLEHGLEYEPATLRTLRDVAFNFPVNRRYPALSFGVHADADTPDTLDAIVEGAPKNQPVVQAYVRSVMRAMALDRQREIDAESARREKARAKAQREREEAEEEARRAKTAAEKKAASDRATAAAHRERQNKMPPKRKDVPLRKPKAEDVPIMVARAAFAKDLAQAKKIVGALRETYAAYIPAFTDADIENGHEELMAIAELARSFATHLHRRGNGGKSSHLSAVGNDG